MNTPAPSFSIGTSFLQVTRACIKAWMSLNFGKIPPPTTELAALEHLKKSIYNVVNTLAPSLLIKSSSFLQVWSEFEIQPDRTMHCGVSCP